MTRRLHLPRAAWSMLAPAASIALAAAGLNAADAPKSVPAGLASIGLPRYEAPAAYSVNLVIESPQAEHMVLHRYVDQGRIRTEITGGPQEMVMIELGDEKGTSLMLMPKDKRAIKQTRELMKSMPGGMEKQLEGARQHETAAPPPDMKVEDLGDETRDGHAVTKLRISVAEGTSLGWFDKATGAPVRIESTVEGKSTAIEWKEYKVGPQPAKLFEVPKNYELTDMDEMMAKMKSMGGMGGMGGMGSQLNNRMGGMGQNMGQTMGSGLGASLGGALGGPVGSIAGQYLGGRIGGAIGRKAAEAVTPGK